MGHYGNWWDSLDKYTADNLISHLTGFDQFLDGHSHLVYNSYSEDKNRNLISIMQTGAKLNNIGMIQIKSSREIITKIISDITKPINIENIEYALGGSRMRWIDSKMKNKLEEIMSI